MNVNALNNSFNNKYKQLNDEIKKSDLVFEHVELNKNNEEKEKKYKKYLIYAIIILVLIIIFFKFKKELYQYNIFILKKFYYYRKMLNKIYKENLIETLLIIFVTEFLIIIFPVPLYLIANAMIELVIENWILSLSIITIISVISGFLVRILIRKFFKNIIKKIIESNYIFKMFLKYGYQNPIYYSLMLRLFFISNSFKEYILSFSNFKERIIILTSIFGYFFSGIQSILLGRGIASIQEIIIEDDMKDYKKINNGENKILFIATIIINLCLILLICYFISILDEERI